MEEQDKAKFSWVIRNWIEVPSAEDPQKLDRVMVLIDITDQRFPGEVFTQDIPIPAGFINSLSSDSNERIAGINDFLQNQARMIHFDWAQVRLNAPPPPPPPVVVPLEEIAAAFGTIQFHGVEEMSEEERQADEMRAARMAGFEPKSRLLR
jgi:hypothetical protein